MDISEINVEFGKPVSVTSKCMYDYTGVFYNEWQEYYIPPVSLRGLIQTWGANSHHGSCLKFRHNEIMNAFIPNKYVSRKDMSRFVWDRLNCGNSYFQLITNIFGSVIKLKHLPALNMRPRKDGRYMMLVPGGNNVIYKKGEVAHSKGYDPMQSIFGIVDWLGGLQAVLLNEDATLFRRKYYLNGTHLGYLLTTTDPKLSADTVKALKEKIAAGKGVGNFRDLYIHSPGGNKDAVQLTPVGDVAKKDDYAAVKNVTAEDVMVAHRVPPELAAIMPGQGNTGDRDKILTNYRVVEVNGYTNEIEELNDDLPNNVKVSFVKYKRTNEE